VTYCLVTAHCETLQLYFVKLLLSKSVAVDSVGLSGLTPGAEYRIVVYSVNGVSDVSGVTQSSDVIVRTEQPGA